MERSDYAVEYGVDIAPSPVDKFRKLFGYGEMISRKDGLEIRVSDLDRGIENARLVILNNNLPLMVKLSGDLAVMRAFMVVHREGIS